MVKRFIWFLFVAASAAASVPMNTTLSKDGLTMRVDQMEKGESTIPTEGVIVHLRSERQTTEKFRVTLRVRNAQGKVTFSRKTILRHLDSEPGTFWTSLPFLSERVADVLSITVEEIPFILVSDFE